jgi:hypothetical protein
VKRVIIIVEGDTELEFIRKTLIPYLNSKEIFSVDAFKIKHSKGGVTKYSHLQTDILNVISETDAIVTTLIDYYGLPANFPSHEDSLTIINVHDRLSFLENSIANDIEIALGRPVTNLIPYLQLHEFEALCFSSFKGIEDNFAENEADYKKIKALIDSVKSPEEINNGALTAPSKRLKNLIKGYNKVVYGNIIIETIGIEHILTQCPKFKVWVETIIRKATE